MIFQSDHDKNLCQTCRLFKEICICEYLQKITLKTRVTLFIHIKEIRRITNTGRLALLCLANSHAVIKGHPVNAYQPHELRPDGYNSLLLVPTANIELNENYLKSLPKPVNLIVPDGTWRQVRRMLYSEKRLYDIPHVRLPLKPSRLSTLRQPPEENFLSTFEAIARALGIIEGNDIQLKLEEILEIMTERLRNRVH